MQAAQESVGRTEAEGEDYDDFCWSVAGPVSVGVTSDFKLKYEGGIIMKIIRRGMGRSTKTS